MRLLKVLNINKSKVQKLIFPNHWSVALTLSSYFSLLLELPYQHPYLNNIQCKMCRPCSGCYFWGKYKYQACFHFVTMPSQHSEPPFCNYSNQLFKTIYKGLNIRGEGHRQRILPSSLCSREIWLFSWQRLNMHPKHVLCLGKKRGKEITKYFWAMCIDGNFALCICRGGSDS